MILNIPDKCKIVFIISSSSQCFCLHLETQNWVILMKSETSSRVFCPSFVRRHRGIAELYKISVGFFFSAYFIGFCSSFKGDNWEKNYDKLIFRISITKWVVLAADVIFSVFSLEKRHVLKTPQPPWDLPITCQC